MTANDDACLIGLMVPLMNESWDEWFDKVRDQYEAELDECHTKYGKGPWTVPYMQDDGWRKPPARQLARKSCGRHPPSLGTQRTPNQGSPSLAETQGKDDSDENDDEELSDEEDDSGDDEFVPRGPGRQPTATPKSAAVQPKAVVSESSDYFPVSTPYLDSNLLHVKTGKDEGQ